MSTISDVQNAMVAIITRAIYPNGTSQPSVAGKKVLSIAVTAGGTLYTLPVLTISGGGGYGALAHAIVTNGVITSVVMDAAGVGYTSVPTITIAGSGSGAIFSITLANVDVFIAAGDFLKRNLDDGLKIGNAFVSVFAINGMSRNTTRLRRIYSTPVIDAPTIILTVVDDTITVGGTITVGQSSMAIVNGTGYAYAALLGDTTSIIAAALAAQIPGATVAGNVITVLGVFDIEARVSTAGTKRRILHSEEGMFRARVIASSHQVREALGNALQIGIAEHGYYMDMPDGISASIRPNKISEVNANELADAFVRDYVYLVEYHVVQIETFHTVADAYSLTAVSLLPPS